MVNILRNQLFDRWNTLPDSLREAIFSEVNTDFIWKTCQAENLPEDKIDVVAKVVGYVLMGFLHPEDVAEEIKERANIDPKTAKTIEDALKARVFTPLAADLNSVYSPLSKFDLPPLAKVPQATSVSTSSISSMRITPKPTVLSDVGWSRASSAGPGIKLTPAPGGAAQPAAAPAAPAEPAPMIIHEDTSFKAVEKNSAFTLTKPGMGAEVRMGQNTTPAPARPAVLEFGGAKPPVPPQNKPVSTGQSSATHYSELKLSLSAVPAADTGPRNVSRIAPMPTPTPAPVSNAAIPVPKPPSPPQPPRPPQVSQQMPQPPQPPKPAQAPQQPPQNGKPIVKDFL